MTTHLRGSAEFDLPLLFQRLKLSPPSLIIFTLMLAAVAGSSGCSNEFVSSPAKIATVKAQTKTGFVNQSVTQMDATHWYVGVEAVFDAWGKSGGGIVEAPIPIGKTVTRFQGTASWYITGNCEGPVLAGLVIRDPANYSHPPLLYPIILNTKSNPANLWFDYSTPLLISMDGLRIEAYGIPKGDCTGDFEIQGIITAE